MDTTAHGSYCPPVPEDVRRHLHAAKDELRKGLETMVPPEFFSHRDAAGREMLLAWRGAIDAAIAHMDARTAPSTPPKPSA